MKIKQGIAILLSSSLLMSGTMLTAPHASAAKIRLNKKQITLYVGGTFKLKLKNCKKKIKWRSSKKKVATVNAKGKVKAKKAGTTTITAKVNGKKYKCRVKVKATPAKTAAATAQPTAKPTATQASAVNTTDTSSTAVSANPVSTAEASPTPTAATTVPSTEPAESDPLAENITITTQILSQHILLTVTNHNTIWLDSVDIHYDYYDTTGENIAAGFTSLYYLPPEETQYISVPFEQEFDEIDESISEVRIDVTEANSDGEYTDLQDKVTITAEEIDTDNAYLPLTVFNHSATDAAYSYAVFFYDAENTLLDAVCYSDTILAKASTEETVSLPYSIDEETGDMTILSETYEIVSFAHGFEETDEMAELINNISLTPQKLTNTLLVTVKNNNTGWLSAVYLDYSFYDSEDSYVTSGSGELLSMKAGETQTIAIDVGEEALESIDLDLSIVEITVEDNTEYYSYNTTQRVTVSTTFVDDSYQTTITNNATQDIEGSYIIYFYDSARTLLDAWQETFSVLQGGGEEVLVAQLPVIYDDNGDAITIASYKVETTYHTIQDVE